MQVIIISINNPTPDLLVQLSMTEAPHLQLTKYLEYFLLQTDGHKIKSTFLIFAVQKRT